MKKKTMMLLLIVGGVLSFGMFGINKMLNPDIKEIKVEPNILEETENSRLLYMGKASIRIVTKEGKVIYIDLYAGNNYDLSADLVLVTHSHYDHSDVSKVTKRTDDFKLITYKEALKDGKHQTFDLGYVKVEAVEAGYNRWHDERECVGYVITLSDDIKIYVPGDTYITPQMDELGSWNINYAFFPCDGVFTMTIEEAIKASKKVNAKHSIPYHMVAGQEDFSEEVANKFNVDNRLIIKNNEEIELVNN